MILNNNNNNSKIKTIRTKGGGRLEVMRWNVKNEALLTAGRWLIHFGIGNISITIIILFHYKNKMYWLVLVTPNKIYYELVILRSPKRNNLTRSYKIVVYFIVHYNIIRKIKYGFIYTYSLFNHFTQNEFAAKFYLGEIEFKKYDETTKINKCNIMGFSLVVVKSTNRREIVVIRCGCGVVLVQRGPSAMDLKMQSHISMRPRKIILSVMNNHIINSNFIVSDVTTIQKNIYHIYHAHKNLFL
ncbi:hypothetical protein AGLY_001758 [Aphis glycines]|uniref:Uncharacterized protein n=1 Tax=Aphis glycines TaxID=307491 RepID=A0A6G0U627_APHGL|nr:hypothetical protein AGLY_001758 [Aphis glycines]